MTVRGRYLHASQSERESSYPVLQQIAGGVRIFYSGLEFVLREERGTGLALTGAEGDTIAVNPEYMLLTENTALFVLPGGTALSFNSIHSIRGPELQITGEFADSVTEVTIPIEPRRSSLIRDSGQLAIMYGGSRFVFSSLGEELETGFISLTRDNTFISYRTKGNQIEFNPEDYIISREQNYDSILRSWQETSFAQWNQNAAYLQNEDDIIAYLSQALTRGNYLTATQNINSGFLNSARQSYRSSAFIGGMTNAYRSFTTSENEKINSLTQIVRENPVNILREEHVLDYLFTRSNSAFANDIISIVNTITPEILTLDHCAGLLEIFSDIRQWRPDMSNPAEPFTEQILQLISENLNSDKEHDMVFVSVQQGNNSEYNLRLGKALVVWAEANANAEWAAIGRSLIISVLTNTRTDSSAGRIHNIIKPATYNPRAVWLTNEGHWAWTVSQSISASYINGDFNIAVNFPVNMTHHLMVHGVRPFVSIQIHGQVWRSDPQFERYDSSGWVYYPDDQILILRLRHRIALENIRIVYRAPAPTTVG
ncbi:MAG: hypothetical protein FWC06_01695 [Treponema sp.]|nr:hypothetical protein [Treponema sp.]